MSAGNPLRRELPIDDIPVCYHVDANDYGCGTPKPGLLLDAARDWPLDLARCFIVEDRWRDIYAGRAAGSTSILADAGYDEGRARNPDFTVASLAEAEAIVLDRVSARATEGH
ncbi:MAG: HAD hydrolase-like protein [Proteobacteria bacterium]|nr:HAD hydrolase-like protein [Pseudomonadota bacterium]